MKYRSIEQSFGYRLFRGSVEPFCVLFCICPHVPNHPFERSLNVPVLTVWLPSLCLPCSRTNVRPLSRPCLLSFDRVSEALKVVSGAKRRLATIGCPEINAVVDDALSLALKLATIASGLVVHDAIQLAALSGFGQIHCQFHVLDFLHRR